MRAKSRKSTKPIPEGFKSRASQGKVIGYTYSAEMIGENKLRITSGVKEVRQGPYKKK